MKKDYVNCEYCTEVNNCEYIKLINSGTDYYYTLHVSEDSTNFRAMHQSVCKRILSDRYNKGYKSEYPYKYIR